MELTPYPNVKVEGLDHGQALCLMRSSRAIYLIATNIYFYFGLYFELRVESCLSHSHHLTKPKLEY